MAVSAFTQLGATFTNNTSTQTSLASGSIVFPTTGTDVLGVALIAISGTATAETITCSDNLGNTWTVVAKAETGGTGGAHTAIAYFPYPSAVGGTTATVTVSWGTAVNERFAVFGYLTGHDTASPLDTSGTFTGIGSTASASVSTSGSAAAGGTAVTAFTVGQATDPTGFPGTGWTAIDSPNDATRARSGAFSYQQLASAGTVTAGAYTFTASTLTPPAFSIAVFKAPGTPVNTVAPVVSGTAAVGSTLSTTDGTWTNTPTSFGYQWQRDVGTSGSTWLDITGATSNSYTIPGSATVQTPDIGSKLRARVTATNATGSSAPAASNATTAIAAPAGVNSWRIVNGPVAGSDAQHHRPTLALPVLNGDLLVLAVGCSNADLVDGNGNKQDVGIVEDGTNTWVQDVEAQSSTVASRNTPATLDISGATALLHSGQIFSTHATGGLAYGTVITMTVHGMTAADAGTPDTAENPAGYHGQSPFWYIVAVSTGDSRVLALDGRAHNVDLLTSHAAPSITTANNDGIVFGYHVSDASLGTAAGWWTVAAGFVEIADTASANLSGGESGYQISGEVKVVSAGYTGGAGGTTGANRNVTNLVAAYTAAATGDVTVTPAALTATAATTAPVVAVKVAPAAATASASVPAPTVISGSGSTVTPGPLVAAGSLPAPTVSVTVSKAASAAAAQTSPPSPAVLSAPAAVTARASLPSPNVVGGELVVPGSVTVADVVTFDVQLSDPAR